MLEEKYGVAGARERIYATTDAKRGALKTLADTEDYEEFVVPDGIGGRFSVLTAVGLLPIATAGGDIKQLMAGAAAGEAEYADADLANNPAYQYAAYHNILYRKGYTTELLINYDPTLVQFGGGGSNCKVSQKVRAARISSQRLETSQRTCTVSDNTSKTVVATCLRRCSA